MGKGDRLTSKIPLIPLIFLFFVNFVSPSQWFLLVSLSASTLLGLCYGLRLWQFLPLLILCLFFGVVTSEGLSLSNERLEMMLKIGAQGSILLALSNILSYDQLRRYGSRRSGALISLMDSMYSLGRMLVRDLRSLFDSLLLRTGGTPAWNQYGNALSNGAIGTYNRALKQEEARSLRTAGPSIRVEELDQFLIRVQKISLNDGTKTILRQVSLSLKRSEWIAIIGPSGSGKSTLLKVMAGLERPSEGSLFRNEIEVKGSLRERLSLSNQLLFQNPDDQLIAPTPTQEITYFSSYTDTQAKHLLEKVGLGERSDQPNWTLSFGEKKRVAICALLALQPKMLLLDEPSAGLDQPTTKLVVDLIESQPELSSVVWVTHDWQNLPNRFERVVILKEGEIVFDGAKVEALSRENLLKAKLTV
jgi:cobalt/nickel transport system ATP-binding protein